MADDGITLTVNGQTYGDWTDIKVDRALAHCAADFDITVTERWAGQSGSPPWRIQRFDDCIVAVDGEPIITGYIDHYGPSFDAITHGVKIQGRSKTADIVDCMPDIKGGQFNNYTLDKIARAVCKPFGVNVIVEADVGGAFPSVSIEKCETAYVFLEKLCALRSILAFDNADGNLVLAQAGAESASGALVQGQNVFAANAKLSADKLFQQYVVLAQAPLSFDGEDSQPQIVGKATDPSCPRFRRFAEMAPDPADTATANARAKWRALHNFGASTEATLSVQGFRQPDGSFWKVNQLVPVTSPFLEIDRTMLVSKTSFQQGARGRSTQLTVGPQEAFIPGTPKKKKHKGKGSSALWDGAE